MQIAYPVSDITESADWTPTPYWSQINEVSSDFSPAIVCSTPSVIAEVKLGSLATPVSRSSFVINITANISTGITGLRVQLKEGVTVRFQTTLPPNTTQTYAIALDQTSMNNIVDFTNLSLAFEVIP